MNWCLLKFAAICNIESYPSKLWKEAQMDRLEAMSTFLAVVEAAACPRQRSTPWRSTMLWTESNLGAHGRLIPSPVWYALGLSRLARVHPQKLRIQFIYFLRLLGRELGAVEITRTGLDMMSVNNRMPLRRSA
jgi:hypothetical protein